MCDDINKKGLLGYKVRVVLFPKSKSIFITEHITHHLSSIDA